MVVLHNGFVHCISVFASGSSICSVMSFGEKVVWSFLRVSSLSLSSISFHGLNLRCFSSSMGGYIFVCLKSTCMHITSNARSLPMNGTSFLLTMSAWSPKVATGYIVFIFFILPLQCAEGGTDGDGEF